VLDLFVASSIEDIQRLALRPQLSLGGPAYWFLHRYFVQASLVPGDFSFLNLYEDTEISGYQLLRLRSELHEALVDLSARPSSFNVLLGWTGVKRSAETEDRRPVERIAVESAVHELLQALTDAERLNHRVYAIGD
jgi:hypothetical protein